MTNYMMELRKHVGHAPLLQCGASVIVFDSTCDKVLMLRRSDNDSWCFPGGAVELGEKVELTAIRETYEEAGLKVSDLQLFGVFSGKEQYYRYPNGDEVYNVGIVFITNKFTGEIKVNEESLSGCFFAITELPVKISPPEKVVVEELQTRYSKGLIYFNDVA